MYYYFYSMAEVVGFSKGKSTIIVDFMCFWWHPGSLELPFI